VPLHPGVADRSPAKLCGIDPARYLREAALADARGEVLLPHDLVTPNA